MMIYKKNVIPHLIQYNHLEIQRKKMLLNRVNTSHMMIKRFLNIVCKVKSIFYGFHELLILPHDIFTLKHLTQLFFILISSGAVLLKHNFITFKK